MENIEKSLEKNWKDWEKTEITQKELRDSKNWKDREKHSLMKIEDKEAKKTTLRISVPYWIPVSESWLGCEFIFNLNSFAEIRSRCLASAHCHSGEKTRPQTCRYSYKLFSLLEHSSGSPHPRQ
jgi:hypothetical protein